MSELLLNSSYEQAVIGCLLIDPEMFDQVLSLISSADFDDPTNAEFFSFLCDLHEFGIPVNDIKLVASEAKKRELKIDVAGITEAFTSVPFSDHAVFYAKEVAHMSSSSWTTSTSCSEAHRRAGGRRAYNKHRQFIALMRRHLVLDIAIELNWRHGWQKGRFSRAILSIACVARRLERRRLLTHFAKAQLLRRL